MPIVDKVLINEKDINPEHNADLAWPSKTRVIDFIEKTILQHLEEHGDSPWLTIVLKFQDTRPSLHQFQDSRFERTDVSTERSMSYSQLLSSIDSLTGFFWEKGLRPGDTSLFMAANYLELPVALMGVWKAGGIVVCLSLNLLKGTIEERVRQLRPKFIVTDELRVDRVVEAVRGLDFVQEIFVFGKMNGFTSIGDLLSNHKNECPQNLEIDGDSTVWIAHSSGTTGAQKGTVHTHKSLGRMLLNTNLQNAKKGTKFLFVNVMAFPSGMINMLSFSLLHQHLHCFSNYSCLDQLLEAVDSVKPFIVNLYPHEIAGICRHPNLSKYDLASVFMLRTVGSKIHPIYERQIFDVMPNLRHLNVFYGTTETGRICSNLAKPSGQIGLEKSEAIARHIFGSCGKVEPGCKLKIVNQATGETLGPGEEGEICVQTPSMLKEYLDMPEETANFIRDGWCYMGDKGYYDINENVFIVGRYKELIIYRQTHVMPMNIEKIIMTHPAVEDVGVVGLPCKINGELPLAFVVLRPGMIVTPQEIIDFTNARVPDNETLRGGLRFIDEIPRNDLGKIVRSELMKLLS